MLIPRKYPRIAVRFPISFTGDRDGEGMVSNLSLGGCHVESETVVDRKDYLTLRVYHSFHEPPIKIDVASYDGHGGLTSGWSLSHCFPRNRINSSKFSRALTIAMNSRTTCRQGCRCKEGRDCLSPLSFLKMT